MTTSGARTHAEWLSLLEASGPFLTLPVLKRAMPQGLEPTLPALVVDVRQAYQEFGADPNLQGQWIRWVLTSLLGFDAGLSLVEGPAIPSTLGHAVPEHGETLRPDLVVQSPDGTAQRMLVRIWPLGTALDRPVEDRRWTATPLDRMAELLRGTEVRLGLVTDGERWTLVHAAAGEPTTFVTWEAGIWLEDRVTLDAFVSLLGVHRFFDVPDTDTLEALFGESANAEQEVTGQLGKQVRQAVELLVDAFGRVDREHQGALLEGIEPEEIYLTAVAVMMRLVFLLFAEEQGLFLLGDPLYDATYAVSTLRAQLQEEADRFGEEPLEKRSAAWHRLLAAFRMVHGGVEHEDLRLPAYGGSLFDPDRFPFLEGRAPGSGYATDPGRPLPVDDRTVLHILDALQVLRFRERGVTEARRLSFRALDVEQIGHVYEGLLDHTAVRVSDPSVGLDGSKAPELALAEIEARADGPREDFLLWLAEETGRTNNAIGKALETEVDADRAARLLASCDNDAELADRVRAFVGLLREDLRGLPQVYVADSVYVTKGSERRSSGTYYTPRTLAEEMVRYALEPLVYSPGPQDGVGADVWVLRSPAEILNVKVCDMAMGSGAFLVAACRFLADRLVEAWGALGQGLFTVEAAQVDETYDGVTIPERPEDQLSLAHRLVADRCIYGVDKNPMAVEMAKLSMWLVTLAKDRPFSFLDHALRCGDSLLGLTSIEQVGALHMDPERGRAIHSSLGSTQQWLTAVKEAVQLRRELEGFTVVTLRDAEEKARLFAEASAALETLKVVGDLVVSACLSTATFGPANLDDRLVEIATDVSAALDSRRSASDRDVRLDELRVRASYWLAEGAPFMNLGRRPFHWPLEFPEVIFERGGFDAIVGNPPFLGGKRISGPLGSDYREYLVRHLAAGTKGNADLIAFFFLRGVDVCRSLGGVGLLATNTIAQGDTREVALDRITASEWTIHRAWKSRPWPGDASIQIAQVWLRREWEGDCVLDGKEAPAITSSLDVRGRVSGTPHRLIESGNAAFIGWLANGTGFILQPEEAQELLRVDQRNADVIKPYLNGDDLNRSPSQLPSRSIIYFGDRTLDEAEAYPSCMEVVRERVKPVRQLLPESKRRVRDAWWKFEFTAPALRRAMHGLGRVVVLTRVSRTVMPAFVSADVICSDATVVFAYEDDAHFGLLSSAFHWWWAVTRASTMRTDLRYTPTDCFETFPQPVAITNISEIARALDEHRRPMMVNRSEGLTKTYNRIHDETQASDDVVGLRELHVALDRAVAAAYGWNDLRLDHGFHDTPQGVRYTLGRAVRIEILARLLELNHERHAQEVAKGLHGRKSGRKTTVASMGHPTLEGFE